MTSAITTLRPHLTREHAMRALLARGAIGLVRRWARGPLRRLADVYLPFSIFLVKIESGGRKQTKWFAFDSAFGVLDPYEFPGMPGPDEIVTVETCNAVPAAIDKNAAALLLTDKIRRMLFSQGFFRLRDLNIRVRASGETVHIPYWVGFYGDGERASMRVMDAVRCRTEGAKMRDELARWLCA
jgi:hypothetical protein